MADLAVTLKLTTKAGPIAVSVTTTEDDQGPEALVELARQVDDQLQAAAAKLSSEAGAPVTCRMGCDACCHQLVPLTAAEAETMLADIAARPEAEREQIAGRFAAAIDKAQAAGLAEAMRATLDGAAFEAHRAWADAWIACPWLGDHTCRIYAERPLACRGHTVTSPPEACSDPRDPRVRRLPQIGNLARALTSVAQDLWPDSPARIPLPLLFEWAQRRAPASSTKSGLDWLRTLINQL